MNHWLKIVSPKGRVTSKFFRGADGQALMDMAILKRRQAFGRTREEEEQARMDMAIIQRRKLKLDETIVWF